MTEADLRLAIPQGGPERESRRGRGGVAQGGVAKLVDRLFQVCTEEIGAGGRPCLFRGGLQGVEKGFAGGYLGLGIDREKALGAVTVPVLHRFGEDTHGGLAAGVELRMDAQLGAENDVVFPGIGRRGEVKTEREGQGRIELDLFDSQLVKDVFPAGAVLTLQPVQQRPEIMLRLHQRWRDGSGFAGVKGPGEVLKAGLKGLQTAGELRAGGRREGGKRDDTGVDAVEKAGFVVWLIFEP